MIFGAKESWDIILYDSKVFTPLTNLLPHFLTSKDSKVEHIWVVNMKSEQTSRLKKRGKKKLVRGWKTFGFFRSRSQLSFAQKIIKKSLKLANVVQLAQMLTFAPNPGKKVPPLKPRNDFYNTSRWPNQQKLSSMTTFWSALVFTGKSLVRKKLWKMLKEELFKFPDLAQMYTFAPIELHSRVSKNFW